MIPKYHEIMKPLLESIKDAKVYDIKDVKERMANYFQLTDEERRLLLQSGQQTIFDNRVGWAKTYLLKAVLISSPSRGFIQITDRGKQVLKENPPQITAEYLMKFEEFKNFKSFSKNIKINSIENTYQEENGNEEIENPPEEIIQDQIEKIHNLLKSELYNKVKQLSPSSFEKLVLDLIVKMGYGGSIEEAKQHLGRSSDEGVDGVIKQDFLGLDNVYLQAKRWSDTNVGRREIQGFVGALHGKGAKKGIFITTSSFTKEAIEYAQSIKDMSIVLIDGEKLMNYLIKYDIGVQNRTLFNIKKLDEDYFEEL